jgi:guanylate kinase
MILIISGKTASGKTAVVNELVKMGYEQIVTYTTRPPRKGEKDGITYNYISEDEFLKKVAEGFFAEYKSYDTVDGTWYYGSAIEDYTGDKVVILTPSGHDVIKQMMSNKAFGIYLFANNKTLVNRLVNRKDKKAEAERRLKSDELDFKGFENRVDKIVYNNSGSDICSVALKIDALVKEKYGRS